MEKYRIILFDADNTLFDFDKSAEMSFHAAASALGVDCTDKLFESFRKINDSLWKALEEKKIERKELYTLRFRILAEKNGIQIDAVRFNSLYKRTLSACSVLIPGAVNVIERLYDAGKRLFIVTNGDYAVQTGRLKKSGIEAYFEDIFVSESIGEPKPSPVFFDHVKKNIKNFDISECLLVGDSQTSDIKGANLAGIDACYYNPHGIPLKSGLHARYEIDDIRKICAVLLDRSE